MICLAKTFGDPARFDHFSVSDLSWFVFFSTETLYSYAGLQHMYKIMF